MSDYIDEVYRQIYDRTLSMGECCELLVYMLNDDAYEDYQPFSLIHTAADTLFEHMLDVFTCMHIDVYEYLDDEVLDTIHRLSGNGYDIDERTVRRRWGELLQEYRQRQEIARQFFAPRRFVEEKFASWKDY